MDSTDVIVEKKESYLDPEEIIIKSEVTEELSPELHNNMCDDKSYCNSEDYEQTIKQEYNVAIKQETPTGTCFEVEIKMENDRVSSPDVNSSQEGIKLEKPPDAEDVPCSWSKPYDGLVESINPTLMKPSYSSLNHVLVDGKTSQCNTYQNSLNENKKEGHIDTNSDTGEKRFICDVCLKSFREKRVLREHSRIHTGEKPYKCDICQNKFTNKHHLIGHLRTHTGERPYKCNECDKAFKSYDALSRHLRIHTGVKPYKCNTCDKRFNEKATLNNHIRVHTGEKPFKCETCQWSFTEKSSLKRHNRIHTGEKPYICEVCNKGFKLKSTLNRHNRTHR